MRDDAVKRVFDVVVATLAIIVTVPLWFVIAVAIKAASRGPVIYRAARVGKNGRTFQILKFRTMTPDDGPAGPLVTRLGDPRVTFLGQWLRRTKLDELPQLVNVLRGDMSLVGPRPEDPHYVALYSDEQRRVLTVRPGIVGPAAIEYRHEEAVLASAEDFERAYIEVVLPRKLQIDLEYVDHHSLWGDVKILLTAADALFRSDRPIM